METTEFTIFETNKRIYYFNILDLLSLQSRRILNENGSDGLVIKIVDVTFTILGLQLNRGTSSCNVCETGDEH